MAKGFKKAEDITEKEVKCSEAVQTNEANNRFKQASANMDKNSGVSKTEPVYEHKTIGDIPRYTEEAGAKVNEFVNEHIEKNFPSIKKWIAIAAAAVIVFVGVCVTVHCYKGTDTYLYSLIDNGETQKLSELYTSRYKDSSRESKFLDRISSYMNERYEEYVEDEITYPELISRYDTIEALYSEASLANISFGQYRQKAKDTKENKELYQKGTAYLEQKEYTKAIDAFRNILNNDNNYPGASEKLSDALAEYRQALFDEADAKMSSADYSGAIETLETGERFFENGTDFTNKLTEVKSSITSQAIATAEADFSNSGYEKAISDISNAISTVGENSELNAALEKYKAYVPVNLFDMDYIERSRDAIYQGASGKDNTNAEHTNVFYAYHKGPSDENQYRIYALMGKYDTLTFEAYRMSTSSKRKSEEVIIIHIYGDDRELQSIRIDEGFSPQTYSLDISGVQKLKIEFESGWTDASQWSNRLPGAIANAVVAKTK